MLAHFVSLTELAMETTQLLLNHEFSVHGLLLDVVSGQFTQFSPGFWGEFCRLIGATTRLRSAFTPSLTVRQRPSIKTWRHPCKCLLPQPVLLVFAAQMDGIRPHPGSLLILLSFVLWVTSQPRPTMVTRPQLAIGMASKCASPPKTLRCG